MKLNKIRIVRIVNFCIKISKRQSTKIDCPVKVLELELCVYMASFENSRTFCVLNSIVILFFQIKKNSEN
jgi:hypothetical protein